MTVQPPRRRQHLVVSLHDVTPAFDTEIREQVGRLGTAGVSRLVLNVVPNWHGTFRLSQHPEFVAFLKREVDAGSEVCLHGEQHRVRGPIVAGSAVTGVRARLFAPEASEFLSLSLEEARTAVAAGLAEVKRASLPTPSSFCAPAWLLPAEYKDVLRSAGLSTYVGMYSIEQLDGRGTQFTPGFGYMGGSGPHELGIRALNFLMTPAIRRADVVAVYLHPDVTGRRRWLRVTETLASLMRLGTYTAETYCGLFHSLCTGVML